MVIVIKHNHSTHHTKAWLKHHVRAYLGEIYGIPGIVFHRAKTNSDVYQIPFSVYYDAKIRSFC